MDYTMYLGKHPRPKFKKLRPVRVLRSKSKRKPKLKKPKKTRVRTPKLRNHSRDLPTLSTYPISRYTRIEDPNSVPAITQSHNTGIFGANSRTRVLDPNWKVKVAKRQDATNPYTLKKYEGWPYLLTGSGFWNLTFPTRTSWSFGTYQDSLMTSFVSWDDPSTQDLGLKRLKRKISRNIGLYDAVVPIVELRELRKGCVDLLESATDVQHKLNSLVKRRRLSGKSLRSAIANAWLQWSFGIKPILSDIRNANAAITKFLTREDHVVTLKAGSYNDRTSSYRQANITGLQAASITAVSQVTEQLYYSYSCGLDLKVKSSNDYSAANVFGLDPDSIIPTLYELTPYSWLLDYFTSVGDYLNDTFELPSNSTVFLSLTRTYYRRVHTSAYFVPNGGSVLANQICKPGIMVYKEVVRSKLSSVPHLSLRIKTFEEIGKNGEQKLANLLSLVRTAHGGRY